MAIVCGTDFSEPAQNAASVAAALAARLQDPELWIVHATDPTMAWLDPFAHDAMKKAAEGRLREEIASLRQRTGVGIQHAIVEGPPTDALLAFAESKKAQLLVVGSRGRSSSPLYRLGGTSERLERVSRLPILVVRDRAPFDSWMKKEWPLRVLLAVDWSRSCEGALGWVKALRASGGIEVVVGHVYYSDSYGTSSRRYGTSMHHSFVERDLEAEALLVRDLRARLGPYGGEESVIIRPKHGVGRTGDHLLEIAEEEHVDLIVMGTHHRRGLARLGSVASVTLHHSRASVAIIPVREDELPQPDEVPRIRRVLVATDLSPFSNVAVPFGYTLVSGGGEVYLLHVRGESKDKANEKALVAQLRSLVPTRGVPADVVTRVEVVERANAAQAIGEAAERLAVDAICVGSHGRTGVRRAVLGSIAETVVRESKMPVFVVRPLPP